MSTIYADRVADTTSTTGTGAFALDDISFTGYRAFSDVCSNADAIYYAIQHRRLDEWEVGQGTYSSGNLTRSVVIASSNSNSAVDFSTGTKDIFGTFPASLLAATQLITNIRVAKTAAYTLTSAENGKTVALGGSAFYQLTVGAANTYDANFICIITNEDTGRGKRLTINGLETFVLWPGQTMWLYNSNNVWHVHKPVRWETPTDDLNMYTDFSVSTGDTAINDGLGVDAPFRTVAYAVYLCLGQFDMTHVSAQTRVVINMASNQNDTNGLHWAPHAFVGAQGGAALKIKGGTNSILSNTSGEPAIQTYFGSVLQLEDITIRSTTSGINAHWGSKIYLISGVIFGGGGVVPAGAHIVIQRGAQIEVDDDITFAGSSAYGIIVQSGGLFFCEDVELSFSANAAYSGAFFYATTGGFANFLGTTVNLNAHTITGARFQVDYGGMVQTGLLDGDLTYFPGDANGTLTTDGKYDHLQALGIGTTHGDADITLTVADVPKTTLTAGLSTTRTWTMPLAADVPAGTLFRFTDGGGIGGGNNLVLARQGSDHVRGPGLSVNVTLTTAYSSVTLESDGSATWFVIGGNYF